MKRSSTLIVGILIALGGCGQGGAGNSAANVPPTDIPTPTSTVAPTNTPAPTAIPLSSLDLSDLLIQTGDPLPGKLKGSGDAKPVKPEKDMKIPPVQSVRQEIRAGSKNVGGVTVWVFSTPNEALNYFEDSKDGSSIGWVPLDVGERGYWSGTAVQLSAGPREAGSGVFVRCSTVAFVGLIEQANQESLTPYMEVLDKRIQDMLCPSAVALSETPVATLRPTSTPAPTETPIPTKVVASALKTLGIPHPPNSTIFSPGILGADNTPANSYISEISKILTAKYPENNIELVAQEVFVTTEAIADMRTFYDVELQGTGWTFLQGSPMDKGQSVIYTRSVSGSNYGLHVTILPDATSTSATPATLVFLTIGRTN